MQKLRECLKVKFITFFWCIVYKIILKNVSFYINHDKQKNTNFDNILGYLENYDFFLSIVSAEKKKNPAFLFHLEEVWVAIVMPA